MLEKVPGGSAWKTYVGKKCLVSYMKNCCCCKVPGEVRGKLMLEKVPGELRGKTDVGKSAWGTAWKTDVGKIALGIVWKTNVGKVILEKVPGELREKLMLKKCLANCFKCLCWKKCLASCVENCRESDRTGVVSRTQSYKPQVEKTTVQASVGHGNESCFTHRVSFLNGPPKSS